MTCTVLYPSLLVPLQLLAMLDISGHWLQMYRQDMPRHTGFCETNSCHSSMLQNKTSHKMIDLSENAVLRYYYMKVSWHVP